MNRRRAASQRLPLFAKGVAEDHAVQQVDVAKRDARPLVASDLPLVFWRDFVNPGEEANGRVEVVLGVAACGLEQLNGVFVAIDRESEVGAKRAQAFGRRVVAVRGEHALVHARELQVPLAAVNVVAKPAGHRDGVVADGGDARNAEAPNLPQRAARVGAVDDKRLLVEAQKGRELLLHHPNDLVAEARACRPPLDQVVQRIGKLHVAQRVAVRVQLEVGRRLDLLAAPVALALLLLLGHRDRLRFVEDEDHRVGRAEEGVEAAGEDLHIVVELGRRIVSGQILGAVAADEPRQLPQQDVAVDDEDHVGRRLLEGLNALRIVREESKGQVVLATQGKLDAVLAIFQAHPAVVGGHGSRIVFAGRWLTAAAIAAYRCR